MICPYSYYNLFYPQINKIKGYADFDLFICVQLYKMRALVFVVYIFSFFIFRSLLAFIYSILYGNVYFHLLYFLNNFLKHEKWTLDTCVTGIVEISLSISCVVVKPTEKLNDSQASLCYFSRPKRHGSFPFRVFAIRKRLLGS